jgi:flagellar basal-body rod modification protein FlgD
MRIDNQPADLGGAPAPTASAPPAAKDQFLRLLVAQLEHQNPLDPQDGAAFVAQLAQFSSLEQVTESNQRLAALEAGQATGARAAMTDVVGRGVLARADQIELDPGAGALPELSVHLGGPAAKVEVVVTDAEGHEVKRFAIGPHPAGNVPIPYDGTDAAGHPLPPGTYHFAVEAESAQGGAVAGYAQLRGHVSALVFGADGASHFRIGGVTITPADIISIEE